MSVATACPLLLSAHVGSPDTWYAGDAGPYRVLVHIRAPGVIPGIAEVEVQVEGEGAREVLANVNRFDAVAAAPPPDRARPVRGQPNTWQVQLWVMTAGSSSFTVRVRGDRGEGVAVVPATIVAFRRLDLSGPLAIGLAVVGMFLFAGAVTIAGAAVRESGLSPGQMPDERSRRSARFAMALTAAVLTLALFGGKRWWDAEDRAHRASMFRPLESEAHIDHGSGQPLLRFVISDTAWRRPNVTGAPGSAPRSRFTPLVPDHGKLMHLFAVRDDLSAIAHLHPATTDTVTFMSLFPPLPAGNYRIFADITHESGYAQTLPAAVGLTTEGLQFGIGSDGDDSWLVAVPSRENRIVLDSTRGITMTWEREGEIEAGRPANLSFQVSGDDLQLEPYMGMDAHAIIVRDDGGVFIHLHPMGTISAASQLAVTMRQASDTIVGMLGQRLTQMGSLMASHAGHGSARNVLSFPYAFPAAGNYAIWVQVKESGRVLTGAFAVEVR
jgi:hypothetical protein